MKKTIPAITMLAGLGLLAWIAAGCGPDKELGGTPVPNLQPNTELTAGPPDLLEGSFIVAFNWTGFDPDGRVRGFQWKLSNNGNDGISVQDTLTFDPVTGDTLNPWHFSAGTDTTLLVSADQDSFPRDPAGFNRSYQTHSFFVRAIDEDGSVDPTPAYVSFNATTLLPSVAVVGPSGVVGQTDAAQLPPSVAFLYSGSDPDFSLGLPTKVRFLWKRALIDNGARYANSKGRSRGKHGAPRRVRRLELAALAGIPARGRQPAGGFRQPTQGRRARAAGSTTSLPPRSRIPRGP